MAAIRRPVPGIYFGLNAHHSFTPRIVLECCIDRILLLPDYGDPDPVVQSGRRHNPTALRDLTQGPEKWCGLWLSPYLFERYSSHQGSRRPCAARRAAK